MNLLCEIQSELPGANCYELKSIRNREEIIKIKKKKLHQVKGRKVKFFFQRKSTNKKRNLRKGETGQFGCRLSMKKVMFTIGY